MSLYESFRSVVAPKGRRATWLPLQFVEAWQEFVAEAMAGFSGDLYEYENEITVRNDLELALGSRELQSNPEWLELQRPILAADELFKELLARGPSVRPGADWWHERVPPHAGDEFIEDARRMYGVRVEAV